MICRIHLNRFPRQNPAFNSNFSNFTVLSTVTLVVTTPQATVLLAFDTKSVHTKILSHNNLQEKIEKSFNDLRIITGMSDEELRSTILTLCDSSLPLLNVRFNEEKRECYSLSDQLLNGSLGGRIVRARASSPLAERGMKMTEGGLRISVSSGRMSHCFRP